MIIDSRAIGGYYGISREVEFAERKVTIHFHAYLSDELDLVFEKQYATNEDALWSIASYLKESPKAELHETLPTNNDWKTFEQQVNGSVIQLFKDALQHTLHLPDGGAAYALSRAEESDLLFNVTRHEKGEYCRFVNYAIFQED
jgi:RNAse (barnase) inhibitor barstar